MNKKLISYKDFVDTTNEMSKLPSSLKYTKILCFTTSYNRQKFLRGCVRDIAAQSYDNLFHTVNVVFDKDIFNDETVNNQKLLFDDLVSDKTSFLYSLNQHVQFNQMNAIFNVKDYEDYDLFIKIDDDDIYKKDYVKTIVDFFNNNQDVDIVSSRINTQLNGFMINKGEWHSFGENPEGTNYKMPFTFAFNLKALNLIKNIETCYHWEDKMWRDYWTDANCIEAEVDNTNNIIWNVHGKNTVANKFLKDPSDLKNPNDK